MHVVTSSFTPLNRPAVETADPPPPTVPLSMWTSNTRWLLQSATASTLLQKSMPRFVLNASSRPVHSTAGLMYLLDCPVLPRRIDVPTNVSPVAPRQAPLNECPPGTFIQRASLEASRAKKPTQRRRTSRREFLRRGREGRSLARLICSGYDTTGAFRNYWPFSALDTRSWEIR